MYEKWLEKARRYMDLARKMYSEGYYSEACFFSQQAIEFLLKAYIIKYTGSRPYTHNIIMLLTMYIDLVGKESLLTSNVKECAKYLAEQYAQSRYPDARLTEYDVDDAEKCIRCMEEVYMIVGEAEKST